MGDLVVVGEGVWISFKQDSTLRLYNATTFTHMQDLDIAPAIKRNIGMLNCYIFASTCTLYVYMCTLCFVEHSETVHGFIN